MYGWIEWIVCIIVYVLDFWKVGWCCYFMRDYIMAIMILIWVLFQQIKLVEIKGRLHFFIVFILILIFDFMFWGALNQIWEVNYEVLFNKR